LLVNRLPPAYSKGLVTLGLLGGVVFTGLVAWMSAGLVWDISKTDQTSEELEWPMWVVYLCIPLGSSLMCYRFLQAILRFCRDGDHARTPPSFLTCYWP
jgi:C4-dicarboxylate transporter DctQ subunit